MAVSNDYIAYVIEQLAALGRVTSRRMFGGVGLYADGLFFAILDGDMLYFKTDDTNRSDYEARGCKPFCPFPDKPEMKMNYHDVPAELLDDAEELIGWARKAVAVALSAVRAKSSSKQRRTAKRPAKKLPTKKLSTNKQSSKKQASKKKPTKAKPAKKLSSRRTNRR